MTSQEFTDARHYALEYAAGRAPAVISRAMAAEIFGITLAGIDHRLRTGALDAIRVGKMRLVRTEQITDSLDEQHEKVRKLQRILEASARRGHFLHYAEPMEKVGLDHQMSAHRSKFGGMLADVSRIVWEELERTGVPAIDRFLISVLVRLKADPNHMPSSGFFDLAGDYYSANFFSTPPKRLEFIQRETERTFAYYKEN